MNRCGLCGCDLEHGYLCPPDVRMLTERLDRLPLLYKALAPFIVPSARSGADRVSSGHAASRMPVNEAVLELRVTGIALVLEGWRADIQRVRGWGEPAIAGDLEERVRRAARWIGMTSEWIASSYPAAGDLAREVREIEGAALSAIGAWEDRGRLIGSCVALVGTAEVCGAPLRHRSGEKTLICPACRCEYTAQDFLLLYNLQPEPEEAA